MMPYLMEAVVLSFLIGGITGCIVMSHWLHRHSQGSESAFLSPQKAKTPRK